MTAFTYISSITVKSLLSTEPDVADTTAGLGISLTEMILPLLFQQNYFLQHVWLKIVHVILSNIDNIDYIMYTQLKTKTW